MTTGRSVPPRGRPPEPKPDPTWLRRWLPDLKEALAATIGAVLLVWQGVFAKNPSIPVLVVGLALMGVLATGVVQRLLMGSGNGNGKGR